MFYTLIMLFACEQAEPCVATFEDQFSHAECLKTAEQANKYPGDDYYWTHKPEDLQPGNIIDADDIIIVYVDAIEWKCIPS